MTPLGWFGAKLGARLSLPWYVLLWQCWVSVPFSGARWGCPRMSIQGLGAWLPLSSTTPQLTPGDTWHLHLSFHPSLNHGPVFSPALSLWCCSSQRQPLHLVLSLFDTFFKAVGSPPSPLINFYLYLMRCTKPLLPSWAQGHREFCLVWFWLVWLRASGVDVLMLRAVVSPGTPQPIL